MHLKCFISFVATNHGRKNRKTDKYVIEMKQMLPMQTKHLSIVANFIWIFQTQIY